MRRFLQLTSVRKRLSYGNVMATVALFISLGGASYAAIELPAHSVGAQQLRSGAVTQGALGFPLGVWMFNDSAQLDLAKSPTPGCGRTTGSNGPFDTTCDVRLREGAPIGIVRLHRPGRLAVTAVAALDDKGPAGTTAQVQLDLFVNKRAIERTYQTTTGGEIVNLPLQGVTTGRVGANTVGFAADAHYGYEGGGDVRVTSVSLIVTALPGT